MIKLTDNQLKDLTQKFLDHENLCDASLAQSQDCINLRIEIDSLFEKYRIEFCAHNCAILGSKRYAKYKIVDIDKLISNYEYKKLISQNNI
jgi:hypothetical protein